MESGCQRLILRCGNPCQKRQNKPMRVRDLKLASPQKSIVAGSAAVLHLMESFTQASKLGGGLTDGGKLFKVGLHALTLLGHINYEISLRCRESMLPLLKRDLAASLCGTDIPVNSSLFGDEFSRCLKEASKWLIWAGTLVTEVTGRKVTTIETARGKKTTVASGRAGRPRPRTTRTTTEKTRSNKAPQA